MIAMEKRQTQRKPKQNQSSTERKTEIINAKIRFECFYSGIICVFTYKSSKPNKKIAKGEKGNYMT